MKKVLLLIPNKKKGGAEGVIKQLVNYHSYNDDKVFIYFIDNSKSSFWDNEKINIISNFNFFNFFRFFNFLIHLFKNDYERVYSTHSSTSIIIGILKKIGFFKRSKLIFRESTSIFIRFTGIKLFFYKILYKMFYKNADLSICQTKTMKQQLDQIVNVKSIVIHNPFSKVKYDKSFSIFNGEYIVSAGRLIKEKGFDILIMAFNKLLLKNPQLNLVILGDGPELFNLKKIIKSLELDNKVLLTGFVNNVGDYFFNSRACIISSIIEGFPNVLMQMMSCNEKIVSTECAGGINKIKGVITCKPNDVNDLYIKMKNCLNLKNPRNRILFDKYLNNKNIKTFYNEINKNLK